LRHKVLHLPHLKANFITSSSSTISSWFLLLLIRLAPLRVHSATGCQQAPEWLVLGQVDCVGPWQTVGVERLVGLASNFIIGDEVIPLDAKKHTETPLMDGIDPACIFLGNRPALWPVQENRQYTGVVEPQFSWQWDSRLLELLVKALHCYTRECTPSHDVWKAVSWRVDESAQVDKFLHCANLLLQHCDGRGDILNVAYSLHQRLLPIDL